MRHTTIRLFLIMLALLGTVSAFGQVSDSQILEDQDLANARALLQVGRADIIREELFLTDEESAEFWPVYDAYQAEVRVVRDRQATIIADFLKGNRAGVLADEYADGFVKNNFEIRSELLQIQDKYVRRLQKILPALKVARFYQLERQMDTQVDAQLALFVPLIEVM